jgi:hypothetical protein
MSYEHDMFPRIVREIYNVPSTLYSQSMVRSSLLKMSRSRKVRKDRPMTDELNSRNRKDQTMPTVACPVGALYTYRTTKNVADFY